LRRYRPAAKMSGPGRGRGRSEMQVRVSGGVLRATVWLAVVVTALVALSGAGLADGERPRIVIIGFDGADPGLVQDYMERGLLPNMQQLAEEGSFAPLMPTNPPQTPVSWSSFATGLNPGRTEIFDFLQREEGTYIPDFSLATRQRNEFLFGDNNGWVAGAFVGLTTGILVLLVVRLFRARWWIAFAAALATVAVVAVATAGPLGRVLPSWMPAAENNRKGTPFWTLAANDGLTARVIRVPVTFPAEQLPGDSKMLSGLGVPDMRGRVGAPSYFTSDPTFAGGSNEFSLELTRLPTRRGPVETKIVGPFNYPFYIYVLDEQEQHWKAAGISAAQRREMRAELEQQLVDMGYTRRIDVPLRLDIGEEELRWEISGRSGTLRPGEWSDWVVIDFPVNWLVDRTQPLRGMGRFKLLSLDPEVELYFSPVNFHPSCHPIVYSWPPDWAEELAEENGLFKTLGWAIDTWSPVAGVGGAELFLEDMHATAEGYRKIMQQTLGDESVDVFTQIFYFTDRAGHMLWHHLDEGHPLHDPEVAPQYQKAMEETYQLMDELIGEARELAGPDALFMVLSDHGFSSFRRQINYNTWLFENGYLALKGAPTDVPTRNLEQLFDKDALTGVNVFEGIDWSRTKAWAMGLGSIYINLVGREPQGIVMPGEEYEQLVREIKEGLEAEVDAYTGKKPVFRVYHRDDIYHGYDPGKIPDLRPANILDYRVSWQDTLGGLSTQVFEPNLKTWSGDHCSLEPTFVRGIFLVNRPITVADPSITDMAPSILRTLGLEPDADLDGRVIW
jgi:predicted AlkP superfamily phosphohydrolase/phosphomutase